jgi:hypothetical protein
MNYLDVVNIVLGGVALFGMVMALIFNYIERREKGRR